MIFIEYGAYSNQYDMNKNIKGVNGVSMNVCYNVCKTEIVLENRNSETLRMLCESIVPTNLILNMCVLDLRSAKNMAQDIIDIILRYPKHNYFLCSSNEYCIYQLNKKRRLNINTIVFDIGIWWESGVPLGLFGSMQFLNFILIKESLLNEEIISKIRHNCSPSLKLFAKMKESYSIYDPFEFQNLQARYKLDGISCMIYEDYDDMIFELEP
jgi:hypothetical protein